MNMAEFKGLRKSERKIVPQIKTHMFYLFTTAYSMFYTAYSMYNPHVLLVYHSFTYLPPAWYYFKFINAIYVSHKRIII